MQLGNFVARGTRSTIYSWGRGAVAKVPDAGTPDSWIVSESRYTSAVRQAGAPAPVLLGIEQVEGRPVSIYEFVQGPSMWEDLLAHPERSNAYARMLADLQCQLFELLAPVSLPRQRDRLSCKIRKSLVEVDGSLQEALDLLPEELAQPRLCHGDLHPGNVILSPAGPIIVDWFDSSRGDPVGDVARTTLLLIANGAASPGHLPGADRGTLNRFCEEYLRHIRESMSFSDGELARWRAIEAAARLAEGVSFAPLLRVWAGRERLIQA